MKFNLEIYKDSDYLDQPDVLTDTFNDVDIQYSPDTLTATATKDNLQIASMDTFGDYPIGINESDIIISGVINTERDYGYWKLLKTTV